MLVSNVTLQQGLPPAPTVEILDASGPMSAGNYWFALIMDQDVTGDRSYINMNRTGIESMGPATHVVARDPWTSVHIRDIPLSATRPVCKVMASMDGRQFYQIAVAPAVEVTGWFDMTVVSGEFQVEGLYGITIKNPAPRMYGDRVGQMVTREDVYNVPGPDDAMLFDSYFGPTLPGLQGQPGPTPYRQSVMKPSIKPSDIAAGAARRSEIIKPLSIPDATPSALRDVPLGALRYIPTPVDAVLGTNNFVWPVGGPNWTQNGVDMPPAPQEAFNIYPNAGQMPVQTSSQNSAPQAKNEPDAWGFGLMDTTTVLVGSGIGLAGLLLYLSSNTLISK
jgi:hypothetical protein